MTVSSSTSRVSYNGNGSTTVFAYTFRIFDQDDLTVIIRSANGTETVKTITTHYTVSGVGGAGGGNVTMLTAPASGETLVIIREQDLIQELDIVPNDPFPASSVEDALDKLTFMVQQHEETLGRTIKASRTNTISGSEFTISAADRANKVFAFDSSGNVSIAQELGTYRGNWAASSAYNQRDIIKDTSNNNIYICLVAHTSTGSQPISSNADVAKWALIVDAASATSSAAAAASSESAAASSASAASTSESNAATSESNAATSESNASSSASAAATSASNAAASYDSFDDRYLGAKSTVSGDPTLDNDGNALIDGALFFDTTNNVMKVYNLGTTTWLRTTPTSGDQANINTVSGIAADVTTVATNVAGVTSFAEKYRVGSADPGTSLDAGDLFYNTTSTVLKVYNGSAWEAAYLPASGYVTLTGTETLTNKTLTDPAIVGTILEDVYTITDGAAFEIDPGNGSIQLITLGANRTPKATNFANGEAVTLMVDDGTAYTLTWTDATFGGSGVVWKTDGGVAPTLNTTGYTVIVLFEVGGQVYGARVGDA